MLGWQGDSKLVTPDALAEVFARVPDAATGFHPFDSTRVHGAAGGSAVFVGEATLRQQRDGGHAGVRSKAEARQGSAVDVDLVEEDEGIDQLSPHDYELTALGQSPRVPVEALGAWTFANLDAIDDARRKFDEGTTQSSSAPRPHGSVLHVVSKC